jgi:hypothetical protein
MSTLDHRLARLEESQEEGGTGKASGLIPSCKARITVQMATETFANYTSAFGGSRTIEGVQSVGVIATIKHFIANEQEQYRMYSIVQPGISSNVDDRTLHELYLWPFAEGVRSGVGSVMIAYNAVCCTPTQCKLCANAHELVNGYSYGILTTAGQRLRLFAKQLPHQRPAKRRAWLPRLCDVRLACPDLRRPFSISWSGHEHAR